MFESGKTNRPCPPKSIASAITAAFLWRLLQARTSPAKAQTGPDARVEAGPFGHLISAGRLNVPLLLPLGIRRPATASKSANCGIQSGAQSQPLGRFYANRVPFRGIVPIFRTEETPLDEIGLPAARDGTALLAFRPTISLRSSPERRGRTRFPPPAPRGPRMRRPRRRSTSPRIRGSGRFARSPETLRRAQAGRAWKSA